MIFKIFILSLSFLFMSIPASAYSIDDLVVNSKDFDEKYVIVQAEVIGDIMKRGDNVWLNINDGTRAIGIFCAKHQIKNIQLVGDYETTGDWIEVEGIFHRSCPSHGGDLDIHARKIEVLKRGVLRENKVNPIKIRIALILLPIVILVILLRSWR